MTRLGLWGPGTPFAAFQDFIDAIEKRFLMLFVQFCIGGFRVFAVRTVSIVMIGVDSI